MQKQTEAEATEMTQEERHRQRQRQMEKKRGSGSSSSSNSSSSSTRTAITTSSSTAVLWYARQNDAEGLRKILEKDKEGRAVKAHDYDGRTALHVASVFGSVDAARCLLLHGASVNAVDRWHNSPLADAENANQETVAQLLKSYGGLSLGKHGGHHGSKSLAPPLPHNCDWEINPNELDFSNTDIVGKGSFGEILIAKWRGTPVAVKRILPSLSNDKVVVKDFRNEVNLLVKLRHPNIVQFLGAVTKQSPLMLVTEYLRGGDLHQFLKARGALSTSLAVNFAMEIARGMAYLHNEPNVIIHRDLKPRNILLVDTNHLKVGDFGLSKIYNSQHCQDIYKLTGETGSYRYMAPEVFKHRKYDKKVDVFSFAMIFYEMLEGIPIFPDSNAYEAAKMISKGERPGFRSKSLLQDLKELVAECWDHDSRKRPPFLVILSRLEKMKETISQESHWHFLPHT